MAERLFRGVLQLGKHIKDGNLTKPMQEMARKLSTIVDEADEFISRAYFFGHIKDGNLSTPMQEMARKLSTIVDEADEFISRAHYFGHIKDDNLSTTMQEMARRKLSTTVDEADEFISRAYNFGQIKDVNLSTPMQEMARRKLSTTVDEADEFISTGYNFGHPPFGAHYGLDVPIGRDGLPEYVDWTEIPGAVWPAQDQGDESELCYMFSTLGSVGALNFIKTGESVELSAQQVLDCNTLTAGGVGGGDPSKVLDFIIKAGGILPSSLYPFTGERGTCKCITGPGVTIDGWKPIKPDDESALKYAVAHQPVVVAIRTGGRLFIEDTIVPFQYYSKGILSGPNYTKPDHSALLVGYNKTKLGKLYWILLNSFSCDWGDDGKFWIARGTRQRSGALGILSYPIVPLKSSPNGIVISKCESCGRCF